MKQYEQNKPKAPFGSPAVRATLTQKEINQKDKKPHDKEAEKYSSSKDSCSTK